MTITEKTEFLLLGQQKRNGEIKLSWKEIGDKFNMNCSADSVRNKWKYFSKKLIPKKCNNIVMKSNNKNTLDVEIPTDRITSLDDALKLCKVDLDVWEVERWKFNKWEVGRKDKQVDMSYSDGVSNGSVKDSGKINVEPLYKIYISFIRKKPVVQDFPVIKPVRISTKFKSPELKKESSGILEALLIPDIHFGFSRTGRVFEPFHDRKALDLVLQVIKDRQPSTIVLMGDLLDMTEWSDKFVKKPEFYFTTQPALEEAAWWLARIRKEAQHSRIIYLEGNHEARMRTQLFKHMLPACRLKRVNQQHNEDVLSIPYLLGLDELGIEYKTEYPKNEYWLNNRMKLIHGSVVSSKSGGSVNKMIQNTSVSVAMGHIHRIEKVEKTVHVKDKTHIISVFSMGTLARLDGVVPSRNGKENWQQGFGYVYYKAGNGHIQPNTVSIINGACIFEGKTYTGVDTSADIEQVLKFREKY